MSPHFTKASYQPFLEKLITNVDTVNFSANRLLTLSTNSNGKSLAMTNAEQQPVFSGSKKTFRQGRYGHTAIITGASDGIGREFARALAAEGLNLVLVARRMDRLEALATELSSAHAISTSIISADLGTNEGVAKVIAETTGQDIGLLIAAAGFGSAGSFIDLSVDDEANMVDVNCRAMVRLTHHFANGFKARGGGGILLMSSLLGFQGVSYSSTYAATKAFVQSFAEGLHGELKPFKVDVLAVAPGPVSTGFAARASMKFSLAAKPNSVAKAALAALGYQTTCVPGVVSQMLNMSLLPLPRWGKTFILTKVMRQMAG